MCRLKRLLAADRGSQSSNAQRTWCCWERLISARPICPSGFGYGLHKQQAAIVAATSLKVVPPLYNARVGWRNHLLQRAEARRFISDRALMWSNAHLIFRRSEFFSSAIGFVQQGEAAFVLLEGLETFHDQRPSVSEALYTASPPVAESYLLGWR